LFSELTNLTRLSLVGNAVTRLPDYRLYVIALLPRLRVLDFNKVKAQERLDALKRFGVIKRSNASNGAPSSSASAAPAAESAKTFVPGDAGDMRRITPELKAAIKVILSQHSRVRI
jgi:U2 small nuclear ribonucleoprotein A'